MHSWFKYGFLSAAGYIGVIAVLAAIFQYINSTDNIHESTSGNNPIYIVAAIAGFVVAFLAGFCFRPVLARIMSEYSAQYPDMPQDTLHHLCREKLLVRYFGVFSCASFLSAIALIPVIDVYPEIVCTLSGAGFTFAFMYFQCRSRYKHLYRAYRLTASHILH